MILLTDVVSDGYFFHMVISGRVVAGVVIFIALLIYFIRRWRKSRVNGNQ